MNVNRPDDKNQMSKWISAQNINSVLNPDAEFDFSQKSINDNDDPHKETTSNILLPIMMSLISILLFIIL